MNSGITGSINREWNACDVRTRRATIPCSARRSWNLRMLSSDPATTQLSGSLTAARSTSGERYSAIASGLNATATMTPRGDACIRRARIDTALIAVGRSKTPATVAATYSPMLCPANAAGADTVGLDQLRQRVFHGEQRGLGPVGALQVPSGPVEHLRTQVDAQLLGEPCGAFIEVLGEHRLGLVKAASHSDVLSALTREEENDSRPGSIRRPATDSPTKTLSCSAARSTAAACC